ncbi:MAG: GGDEF domain-containing protein [Gammaproteobacteria bacterium]|nr:GGDEF domain-containing protein [Gammaproteobacteria bacterium]
MHNPVRIFVYGLATLLVLMSVLAIFTYLISNGSITSTNLAVASQLEKINLTQALSTVINNRTRFIQLMLLQEENLANTEEWLSYNRFEAEYGDIREKMTPFIDGKETQTMLVIDKHNQEISELVQQVSVLFLNGSRREATEVLLEDVLPRTGMQFTQLSQLIKEQQQAAEQTTLIASQQIEQNRSQILTFSIVAILTSLVVACLTIYFGLKLSNQLSSQFEEMNDYLEDRVNERTESLLDVQKELIEDNNELARLASTDNLTGLSNRNHMSEILTNEHSRFIRHRHRFGIIMLDIDHYKSINDTYGHDVGDQVLIRLAHLFEPAIRNTDYVGRWGGEEFLICCTTLETNDILSIAETIRRMIGNTQFDKVGRLTVSLGCAVIETGESIEELIKRADVALYQAKNSGRNQTVVSASTHS